MAPILYTVARRRTLNFATLPTGQIAAYEYRLMGEYVAFAHQDPAGVGSGGDFARLIEEMARGLEVVLASAAIAEVAIEEGAETVGDVDPTTDRFAEKAEALCGRDPREVFAEHERWLKEAVRSATAAPPTPETRLTSMLALLLTGGRAFADLEIDQFTHAAAHLGVRTWGHRLQQADDTLRSFLRRHEPHRDERLAAAGKLYAEGRISIDDAAGLLGMRPWDVVAEFESSHFCRPLAKISLSAAERTGLLERIRERRLSGVGGPSNELVARDVIATQRIEGVDARPWVKVEES